MKQTIIAVMSFVLNNGNQSCFIIFFECSTILTPPQREVQRMYHRYNGYPEEWYSVCGVEAILDNYLAELVFCGFSCFPYSLAASFSNTVNTMEGNGNS